MKKSLQERFWSKVTKTEDCWKWNGAKHPFGYGMLQKQNSYEKTTASRISWEIHNGEIPDGLFVLHKCDNPECTNPDHLFLGDNGDNMRDKESKWRGNKRFDKDTCDTVATLRSMGVSLRGLARAFAVDRNVIHTAIKAGVVRPSTYKPVANPKPHSPPPIFIGSANHKAKINEADVLEIRRLRAEGLTYPQIAEKFAVGKAMISHICNRRCWTHI